MDYVHCSDQKQYYSCRHGREVHFPCSSNVKNGGYFAETKEVCEYIGYLGMGVLVCQIDTNQSATLKKH